MARNNDSKQRKAAHAEAVIDKFGESELVMRREVNAGSIVAVPGPNMFGDRTLNGGVFGWEAGHGAVCACLDCKKAFEVGDDHPAMKSTDVVECPDCGAVSMLCIDNMGFGGLYNWEDERIVCEIPHSRSLYIAGKDGSPSDPLRAKDSVAFKTVSFGKPAVRGDGDKRHITLDVEFGGELRQITYMPQKICESAQRTDGREVKDQDGQPAGVRQMCVIGAAREHEKNKIRQDVKVAMCRHDKNVASKWTSKMREMDEDFTSMMYTELCAKRLGLPVPYSEIDSGRMPAGTPAEQLGFTEQQRMLQMMFQYPGVVELELGRVNTNIKYDNMRNPDAPVTDFDAAKRRYDALSGTLERLTAMDSKLVQELHACKTADQAYSALYMNAFGRKPEASKMPSGKECEYYGSRIKFNQNMPDATERMLGGKFLKKQFNIDPYMTASNARTAQKLGLKDANHVGHLFEIGKTGQYPHGIVSPVETQSMLRFVKTYFKDRDVTAALDDLYLFSGFNAYANDAAEMYASVCGHGDVARYKDDVAEARYQMTVRQMCRYFAEDGHSVETAMRNEQFREAWGDDTEECVRHFHEIYEKDPNGPQGIVFIPRDGKALFSGRTVRQVHDELIVMDGKLGSMREYFEYQYTPAEMERMTWKGEGIDIHPVKDNNEAFMVGQELNLCTGMEQNLRAWQDRSYLMIVSDKSGRNLGCIEITKEPDRRNGGYVPVALEQIKGKNNRTFPGHADEILDWMKSARIVDRDGAPSFTSRGKSDFGDIGVRDKAYFLGDHFAADGPAPMRREEIGICSKADIEQHARYVEAKQEEAENLKKRNEMKKQVMSAADGIAEGVDGGTRSICD